MGKSLRRKLFGPSRAEVWSALSEELGGEFEAGGLVRGAKVRVKVSEWTVTLDTYTVSTGQSSVTYTRMRAPYVNRDGFRFTIYRKTVFSDIGKLFGVQDVEIGHPDFDRDYVIKGNDEEKLRRLFSSRAIRDLIRAQPRIHLQVKDDEGRFAVEFPEGVDELYFRATGVIKDLERLKALFTLFAVVLDALCHIGSAYEDDPQLVL